MQSGAVWLWRERRGAALGRCRNGGAQPRASAGRAQRTKSADPPQAGGLRPGPAPCWGLAEDRAQTGGGSRAAGPAAEPPPRTKSAKSRPEDGWACGPEFAHCWGLPRNKGKIDYPRRKRI